MTSNYGVFIKGAIWGILLLNIVPFVLYKGTIAFLDQKLYKSEFFLTVVSGVALFVISQYIKESYIERLKEYRRIIGLIDSQLLYYSKIYVQLQTIIDSSELKEQEVDIKEAKKVVRDLACSLSASYEVISNREILSLFKLIVDEERLNSAVNMMLTLSNLDCYPTKSAALAAGVKKSDLKSWNENRYDQNFRVLNEIRGKLNLSAIAQAEFDVYAPFTDK